MPRKAFVVNDTTRERVRYLAGVGVPQDDIARIIGCAPKTLRKRMRDELDRGVAEANATISGYNMSRDLSRRRVVGLAANGALAALLPGCATPERGPSVPPGQASQATVLGLPNERFFPATGGSGS